VIAVRRRRREACAVRLRASGASAGLVLCLALAVTAIGLIWGTRIAAGSDAYGYVSQVDLWLRGDLHIDQSFGARVPWPLARWTFLPLGYRPEPDGYRIVPQYPAGLPLLMAGAKLVAGPCAMFWIVPICGGILVVATYAIGRRLGRPAVGLAAAWLVATSPTLLFMVIAPMSDVPAAAAWAVAAACVLGETSTAAAAGGGAAAAAILIRPNLVPLAGVFGIWLAWRGGVGSRVHGLHAKQLMAPDPSLDKAAALWFSATAAVGVLGEAAINARLYGSPLRTGYDLTDGFALSYVWTNLQHYVGWLVSAETPIALAGLIALAIPSRAVWRTPASARARPLFLACAVVVWTIYLLYVPWDAWWYLRFLLPTWPMAAIGTASLLAMVYRSSPFAWRRPATVAIVVLLGALGVAQAARRETFDAARGEAKYVEVARVVESLTGPDAVIISAQHSGTIRYYAGRLTLRWDVGDPAWLDRTVEWLAAHDHHPYFVLEPQEIDALRARFGPSNAVARLDWTPMVVFRGGAVVMYDALRREYGRSPMVQAELHAVRECPLQRPPPRLR
jgi:hypothetical protein